MSRGRRITLGVLVVVVLAAAVGCSKWLDRFREKHPDPPPGAFPPQVGKMVLEVNERWGKNPNCTRADPTHCWAYYVLPGGDDEVTRTHLYMQLYDSPAEANARLEAYAGESVLDEEKISWEDGVQNVGRLLHRNSIRQEEDGFMFGVCSVSYAKGTRFITIYHGNECEVARQFMRDLEGVAD